MQALPQGALMSSESLERHVDGSLERQALAADEAPWASEIDSVVRDKLDVTTLQAIAAPQILIEIGPDNPKAAIFGQAELAWPDLKVAILHPSFADDFELELARDDGWRVFVADSRFDHAALVAALCGASNND